MRIKDILYRKRNSTQTAVIYKDHAYSYNDIHRQVVFHSQNLMDIGNHNVGIFISNSANYVTAYFSVAYMDRVIIPMDANSKRNQILSTIVYCELDLILTDNEHFEYLCEVVSKELNQGVLLYNVDSYEQSYFGKKGRELEGNRQVPEGEEDVAIMLHTSGTTSDPKKVMLTHENLISNIESNIASLALNSEDRSLIVLPMCFGYCNTSQFLTHFYMGGSIVIYDGAFVPKRFLHYIEKYQCTNSTCIPTMLYLLVKSNRKVDHLSSFRYLCFGGGSISEEILARTIEMLPETGIVQTYGQTEASPRVTCLLPIDATRKLGSVGKAIPGVCVKVFDEYDQEVPSGTDGEIVVRGKNVMKGYYKHPDETERTIINGWLHTGDMGRFDDEGYLYIIGRKKNVIISGGLNIYPEEIEELLRTHPAVSEAYVYPQEHELLGEVPAARIVPYKKEKLDVKELYEYCKDNLEIQKIPSVIEVSDHFEKTYNGKIRRVGNE